MNLNEHHYISIACGMMCYHYDYNKGASYIVVDYCYRSDLIVMCLSEIHIFVYHEFSVEVKYSGFSICLFYVRVM